MSGLQITQLPPAGYLRTPWKNGGGVAIDIAGASRPDSAPGSWDAIVWSFGRTTIATGGPFSDLTGLDRMQMVVAGRGLVLQSPSGEIDLRQPGIAVRFAGHTPMVSRLECGPVEVVNLIGLQRSVSLDLCTLTSQDTSTLGAGIHLLYAAFEPCELQCGGIHCTLPYDHALQIECAVEVAVFSESGRAVIGSVFSR